MLETAGGVAQRVSELQVDASLIALAIVAGTGTSVLAAWIPARNAARVDPVQALQKGKYQVLSVGENRRRRWIALAAFLIASVCLFFSYSKPFFYTGYVLMIGAGLLLPGTVIGFAQWIVLRRHVERVGWWVLACTIGWDAGLVSGWAVDTNLLPPGWFFFPFYPIESAAYWIVVWLVGMVVFSAITGLALASLLFRHDSNSNSTVVLHADQAD